MKKEKELIKGLRRRSDIEVWEVDRNSLDWKSQADMLTTFMRIFKNIVPAMYYEVLSIDFEVDCVRFIIKVDEDAPIRGGLKLDLSREALEKANEINRKGLKLDFSRDALEKIEKLEKEKPTTTS